MRASAIIKLAGEGDSTMAYGAGATATGAGLGALGGHYTKKKVLKNIPVEALKRYGSHAVGSAASGKTLSRYLVELGNDLYKQMRSAKSLKRLAVPGGAALGGLAGLSAFILANKSKAPSWPGQYGMK